MITLGGDKSHPPVEGICSLRELAPRRRNRIRSQKSHSVVEFAFRRRSPSSTIRSPSQKLHVRRRNRACAVEIAFDRIRSDKSHYYVEEICSVKEIAFRCRNRVLFIAEIVFGRRYRRSRRRNLISVSQKSGLRAEMTFRLHSVGQVAFCGRNLFRRRNRVPPQKSHLVAEKIDSANFVAEMMN